MAVPSDLSSAPVTNPGERLVVAALAGGVVASRAELSAATGLPTTTVTGIVGRLLRRGVVTEQPAAAGPRGRGRPAAAVTLTRPGGSDEVIAVLALSHAAIRAAVVGWDGTVAAARHSLIEGPREESEILGRGLDMVEQALADAGLGHAQATCAVVGIPGAYQPGVGIVVGRVPDAVRAAVPELGRVYGWLRSDPVPVVRQRLGVPVVAENYANLAALGEAGFGAGRGLSDLVYVRMVEGIGAGLILGGRLHRGARGLAGELAHVQVVDDGAWCACGSRGCLAVTNNAQIHALRQLTYPAPVTLDHIRGLIAAGERGTRRVMADAGRRIGRVLADLCVMLSPEAIVLDGMLGPAAEPVLEGIREMLDRHTPNEVAQFVQVRVGELGDRAEVLGAAALARAEDPRVSTRYA